MGLVLQFTHTSHTGCILKSTWFQLQELCTSVGQRAVQGILIACPMETSFTWWYGTPLDAGDETWGKKCSGDALILTIEDWYLACETNDNLAIKIVQIAFLRSNLSSPHFNKCTQSQAQSFGIMLKKYWSGELQPLKVKRERSRKYKELYLIWFDSVVYLFICNFLFLWRAQFQFSFLRNKYITNSNFFF